MRAKKGAAPRDGGRAFLVPGFPSALVAKKKKPTAGLIVMSNRQAAFESVALVSPATHTTVPLGTITPFGTTSTPSRMMIPCA